MHLYLSAQEIEKLKNDELAAQISRDYSALLKEGEELLVIVTLKGALFFAADFLRRVTVPMKIDFIRLTSYGAGTKSGGIVHIVKDIEGPATNQHVLVIDEIVDSGRTLTFLRDRLQSMKPLSVRFCSLLSKPSRREVEVQVHYLGREVEDKFLVGYGLDHAEHYRTLKEIFYLDNPR